MALSAACALLKVPVSGHLGSRFGGGGTGLDTEFTGAMERGVGDRASEEASQVGPCVVRAESLTGGRPAHGSGQRRSRIALGPVDGL